MWINLCVIREILHAESVFLRISVMWQIPTFRRRYLCFPNIVWASVSGAFRIISDTLVTFTFYCWNDTVMSSKIHVFNLVSVIASELHVRGQCTTTTFVSVETLREMVTNVAMKLSEQMDSGSASRHAIGQVAAPCNIVLNDKHSDVRMQRSLDMSFLGAIDNSSGDVLYVFYVVETFCKQLCCGFLLQCYYTSFRLLSWRVKHDMLVEKRQFFVPLAWTTLTPDFKVTPLFDVEYLRKGTR